MQGRHPERDLIPYLRGELTSLDRKRVDGHLAACARCRDTIEGYRALLADLGRSVPAAPAVHWGRYRAEVRERIERQAPRPAETWRWLRPVPATLAAALVGVLVLVAVQGGSHRIIVKPDTVAFEEMTLGRRLGLLQRYEVVERLDLFEDLDLIQQLDRLSATSES